MHYDNLFPQLYRESPKKAKQKKKSLARACSKQTHSGGNASPCETKRGPAGLTPMTRVHHSLKWLHAHSRKITFPTQKINRRLQKIGAFHLGAQHLSGKNS